MLRLVQTSDVRLGARHPFLGERAGDQRERQAAAFERTVELVLSTPAELFVIAGDLFASSVEPRALIERVGAALKRVVEAGIPIVLLPGGGDPAGRASIYHAADLVGLVGDGPGAGSLTILAGDDTDVILPSLGARVTSRFPVERPARRRLADRAHPPRDATARGRDRLGRGRLPRDRRPAGRGRRPRGDRDLGGERLARARRRRERRRRRRPPRDPRRSGRPAGGRAPARRPDPVRARRPPDRRPGRPGGPRRRAHPEGGPRPGPRRPARRRLAGRDRRRPRRRGDGPRRAVPPAPGPQPGGARR